MKGMSRIAGVLVLAFTLAGLAMPYPVAADEVHETTVSFGIPRREVVAGLDVAATCGIVAAYEGLVVPDGGKDETFLAMSPGLCAITVFVLGVPVALPIGNAMPIGRTSYLIPGVGGLTLGLADISIDLLVTLGTQLTEDVDGLAVTPSAASWSRWGATPLAVEASLGTSGSTVRARVPFNVTMSLSLGASVYAFGIRLYSASLASLGTVAGEPVLEIPVAVDRRPSPVTATGWEVGPGNIRVNWTANEDDDFSHYRIVASRAGGTEIVFLVEDREATTTVLPASPDTEYVVQVSVVDRSGQASEGSTTTVRTTQRFLTITPEASGVVGVVAVSLLVGFALGLLVRRRKAKDRP